MILAGGYETSCEQVVIMRSTDSGFDCGEKKVVSERECTCANLLHMNFPWALKYIQPYWNITSSNPRSEGS